MNHEQQQIAIAEACGWTTLRRCHVFASIPTGIDPLDGLRNDIPDYPSDLNALAKARDTLITTPELRIKWVNKLRDVIGLSSTRLNKLGQPLVSDIDLLFASPKQLAQALLQTLNLWDDV